MRLSRSRLIRCKTLLGGVWLVCLVMGLAVVAASAEEVVQQASGRGHLHLGPFTVQDEWELCWEVQEDHSLLQVVIDVLNEPGSDMPVDVVTQRGPAKGRKAFTKGGTYLLRIIGMGGAWTVMVVQKP